MPFLTKIELYARFANQARVSLLTNFNERPDEVEDIESAWDGVDYHAQMGRQMVLLSDGKLKLSTVGAYRDELAERILEKLPQGGRVLEAGCGDGINMRKIKRPIDGFDASGERARRAGEITSNRTYQADIRAIPEVESSYDVVYTCHCLEQLPPATVEKGLQELLRVGRQVVLFEPIHELQSRFGKRYQRRAGFGAQTILRCAESVGNVQRVERLGLGNPFNQTCILELGHK